ncbi:hypothetical protein EVAR_91855_1 [Eumeta japonica]|uniref:Uncharacterized protein n=1 Tax=Eumeta variegata TaxID=151549 RepID=A0A4C2ACN7_EUMVA|nr:hypothetical protein EVAR_91855_1 [Eumeta japonica]
MRSVIRAIIRLAGLAFAPTCPFKVQDVCAENRLAIPLFTHLTSVIVLSIVTGISRLSPRFSILFEKRIVYSVSNRPASDPSNVVRMFNVTSLPVLFACLAVGMFLVIGNYLMNLNREDGINSYKFTFNQL